MEIIYGQTKSEALGDRDIIPTYPDGQEITNHAVCVKLEDEGGDTWSQDVAVTIDPLFGANEIKTEPVGNEGNHLPSPSGPETFYSNDEKSDEVNDFYGTDSDGSDSDWEKSIRTSKKMSTKKKAAARFREEKTTSAQKKLLQIVQSDSDNPNAIGGEKSSSSESVSSRSDSDWEKPKKRGRKKMKKGRPPAAKKTTRRKSTIDDKAAEGIEDSPPSKSDSDSEWERPLQIVTAKLKTKGEAPSRQSSTKASSDYALADDDSEAFAKKFFPHIADKLGSWKKTEKQLYPKIVDVKKLSGKNINCYVCGNRFDDKTSLELHLREHPTRNLKVCFTCGSVGFRKCKNCSG